MRILIIANLVPFPPNSGARIRIYQFLRRISGDHEVHFACHAWDRDAVANADRLKELCAGVVTGRVQTHHAPGMIPRMLYQIGRGRPPELSLRHSPELAANIRQIVSGTKFDIIHIEEYFMGSYLDHLPKGHGARLLVTFHNVGFSQMKGMSGISRNPLIKMWHRGNAALLAQWEPRLAKSVHRCITVSERDRELLLDRDPSLLIDVVANGTDTKMYKPLEPPDGPPAFLFIGDMRYPPCVDGARFFASEILPRIRRRVPAAEFWIVGREPTSDICRLHGNGVHVVGAVDDVVRYYRKCHVSVVPLRAGGGTRLKVLEAMALGRPIVSTTLGAEGLGLNHGEHLLIADDAENFAAQSLRALQDNEMVSAMTSRSRLLVESSYDWDALAALQLRIYKETFDAGRD